MLQTVSRVKRPVIISGKERCLAIITAQDQLDWHISEGDAGSSWHIGITLDQKLALDAQPH